LQKDIDKPHGGTRLSSTSRHHEQGAALAGLEGLRYSSDRFVLIGTFANLPIDGRVLERLFMLADEMKTHQIIEREEAGNRARMRQADLPKEMVQPVGHKPKRRHFLFSRDLGHVLAELLLALARVARRALRFDYGEDGAVGMVEAKIGETVPRGGVVPLDGDFELNLRAVAEIPARAL